jgi:hypothetical protein
MLGKHRNQQRRRLGSFEQLEPRAMLAGNVTVTGEVSYNSTSNNIFFYGDSANNRIQIINDGAPSLYRIVGLPDSSTGQPTTVNGLPEVTIDMSNRPGPNSIYAFMGEGDDEVYIRGANFMGGEIHGEGGNDLLQIGDYAAYNDPAASLPAAQTHFTQHFSMYGQTGKDTFKVYNAYFDGSSDILIEAGSVNSNSSQFETAPELVDIYLLNTLQLTINMGGGSDQVNIGYSTVRAGSSILLGRGNDLLSSYASHYNTIDAVGGSGDDFLALDVNAYDSTVRIYGDGGDSGYGSPPGTPGNDTVLFSRSTFNNQDNIQQVWLNTTEGNDTLLVGKYYAVSNTGQIYLANAGSHIPYLLVSLGSGNDTATFAANIIDDFNLFMGGGDDTAYLESNLVTKWIFYGDHEWQWGNYPSSPGYDRLRRYNNSFDPSNANQVNIESNVFGPF